jgi:hypothetical protein
MRKFAIVAMSMATTLLVPTAAAEAKQTPGTSCNNTKLVNSYSANYHAVRKLHGKRAPGRNIRRWGLSNGQDSKCRHLAKSLRTLRAMRMPAPAARFVTTGPPSQPPAGTQTVHPSGTLARIAQCESGGNPRAVNPNGHYGKYQFDLQTWQSVGGSGNPVNASEAEQDKRAAILYSQRGGQPWECKG